MVFNIKSCPFSVVKNGQTRLQFLVLEKFITCWPPEKPRDIAFIPFPSVPSSETQGAFIRVERKGGPIVFKYGQKSPWVPTLTELFPNLQADAGS